MTTVFSHIIQKRFSQVNEDVATDALAYILSSSEAARNGMMKLLRGLIPGMPELHFCTQQTAGSIRPDMWGFAGAEPKIFIENKFWAGLTDNQPVSYLRQLAEQPQPSLLLVIAPEARQYTLWRELSLRLGDAGIGFSELDCPAGISHAGTTEAGPMLAMMPWKKLLSILEYETIDDHAARADIAQLLALCSSAESQGFLPLTSSEVTDQRTPAFILQLGDVIQNVTDLGASMNILDCNGLRPQASWERIGRYVWIKRGTDVETNGNIGVGIWLGIHFSHWKQHGGSPLWVVFSQGKFGRAQELRSTLEPWATQNGLLCACDEQEIAIALDLPTGEDKDAVAKAIVSQLQEIANTIADFPLS